MLMSGADAAEACDFGTSSRIADSNQGSTQGGFVYVPSTAGTFHLSCSVGGGAHCRAGQTLELSVAAAMIRGNIVFIGLTQGAWDAEPRLEATFRSAIAKKSSTASARISNDQVFILGLAAANSRRLLSGLSVQYEVRLSSRQGPALSSASAALQESLNSGGSEFLEEFKAAAAGAGVATLDLSLASSEVTTSDSTGDSTSTAAQAAMSSGGSNLLLIIIIAGASVAALVVVAGVGYYFVSRQGNRVHVYDVKESSVHTVGVIFNHKEGGSKQKQTMKGPSKVVPSPAPAIPGAKDKPQRQQKGSRNQDAANAKKQKPRPR